MSTDIPKGPEKSKCKTCDNDDFLWKNGSCTSCNTGKTATKVAEEKKQAPKSRSSRRKSAEEK